MNIHQKNLPRKFRLVRIQLSIFKHIVQFTKPPKKS